MLKGMRRSAKHILWPLTIAMVITMGGFGVWHLVQPEAARTEVGVIWGQPVRLEEFIQTARAARAIAILGGVELDRRELYMTVWRRIILHREAERMGVTATRRDLARFLARWPAFQVDGRFNAARYSRILGGLGLEAATFEAQIEKILAIEIMQMIVRNQVLVNPAEAERIHRRMNEEVRVEYAEVGIDEASLLEEIPEEEMREYYRQRRGQFQVQTEIEIDYLLVEVGDPVAPDPEEAPEAEPGASPREAEAEGTAAEEAAARRADLIIRMLDYEDSLEKPAEEYGLEIRTSGYFHPGEEVPGVGTVPELGRLVELMAEGEIASYPLRVPDGFLIFQLKGIKEARRRQFEEAREEIRELMLREARRAVALDTAREKLDRVRSLMEEEMDFRSAADEAGLAVEVTPFFTRQGREDIPAGEQFVTSAFLTLPDQVSGLIPGEDGFFFLTVLERNPPPPMEEEEEEEWLEIARRVRGELLYESWFNNLLRRSGFSITEEEFAP